jgi:hypothetical protein
MHRLYRDANVLYLNGVQRHDLNRSNRNVNRV